uniref:Uncharacterized protein n=1 Tax=Timema monikensis TaxID=170555 RepID=A0A7R9HSL8_9NEOP|nr:unnamed protein product [Timema monikensis]
MLRDSCSAKYGALNYEPDPTQEPPRENLISFARDRGYANFEGFEVRDSFGAYFNNDSRVVKKGGEVEGPAINHRSMSREREESMQQRRRRWSGRLDDNGHFWTLG